jgi:hypothetical protein
VICQPSLFFLSASSSSFSLNHTIITRILHRTTTRLVVCVLICARKLSFKSSNKHHFYDFRRSAERKVAWISSTSSSLTKHPKTIRQNVFNFHHQTTELYLRISRLLRFKFNRDRFTCSHRFRPISKSDHRNLFVVILIE